MELKPYQLAALGRLERFLDAARLSPAAAFAAVTGEDDAVPGVYRPMPGLADVPYCCIRLPTGGGKTLLAAHAVKAAAGYVERDYPLALWLCPSTAIAGQTLAALKDTAHPYRRALDHGFGGRVRVLDIGERRLIRPQDLRDGVVVIVGTMQAFRVADTGDRNVYGDDEAFETHFADVPESTPDLERNTHGKRAGLIKLSFANILHRWRPVLILDEAHNFVTGLSDAVKARLSPACVIEFTATPQKRSNTIFAASARALQAAEMIKLPIMLVEHDGAWEAAVAGAIGERARLAGLAAADPGRYLRPITLFQAQPDTGPEAITPAKLKAHLIENERIPAERIAVATGNVHELDGINLLDPACPIEHVITVAALREGWDCSFAYVLCSLANLRSDTAVEQLLGRVLRQPYASRRATEALNRAYAHVSSKGFADTAAALRDKLVSLGFDVPGEARDMVVEARPGFDLPGGGMVREPEPLAFDMDAALDVESLPVAVQRAVTMTAREGGGVTVTIAADATLETAQMIAAVVAKAEAGGKAKAARVLEWQEQQDRRRAPVMRGATFRPIPRLMADVQGELELAERETFLDLAGWTLEAVPARLPSFAVDDNANVYRFELDGEQLVYTVETAALELTLDAAAGWTPGGLVRWLDREIEHADTVQPVFLEWLRRLVEDDLIARGLTLPMLVRGRYALRRALDSKVRAERTAKAIEGVRLLFETGAARVLPSHSFSFDPNVNPAASRYNGAWRPQRHFYTAMGDLNGEETECAKAIDTLAGVRHWVRNGDRDRRYAFWLPTATDAFYPDFVAELESGGLLVVEYKGADRIDNSDTREKDNIGKLWAGASGGVCRFVTVSKAPGWPPIPQQLRAALA